MAGTSPAMTKNDHAPSPLTRIATQFNLSPLAIRFTRLKNRLRDKDLDDPQSRKAREVPSSTVAEKTRVFAARKRSVKRCVHLIALRERWTFRHRHRSVQHHIRDLFRRHQRRKIRVRAGHHGEDRGVDDAQALHALDAALGVDDGKRIVRPAHAAAT